MNEHAKNKYVRDINAVFRLTECDELGRCFKTFKKIKKVLERLEKTERSKSAKQILRRSASEGKGLGLVVIVLTATADVGYVLCETGINFTIVVLNL